MTTIINKQAIPFSNWQKEGYRIEFIILRGLSLKSYKFYLALSWLHNEPEMEKNPLHHQGASFYGGRRTVSNHHQQPCWCLRNFSCTTGVEMVRNERTTTVQCLISVSKPRLKNEISANQNWLSKKISCYSLFILATFEIPERIDMFGEISIPFHLLVRCCNYCNINNARAKHLKWNI